MPEPTETEKQKSVLIKLASKADLPAIENILRATVRTPYGNGEVDESEVQTDLERITQALDLAEEGRLIMARDEKDQALGFAFFGKPDPRITDFTGSDPGTTLELRHLYLEPHKRQQGVGSILLKAVEEEARKSGKDRIELVSGPRYIMIGTGRFYSKMGYQRVGRIDNYFEGKYWAMVYQKELNFSS